MPKSVEKSISPRPNLLAFFPVTYVSFHQVSQILSKNEARYSISGWLHGPLEEAYSAEIKWPEMEFKCPVEDDFMQFVSEKWLVSDELDEEFAEESVVEIADFLDQEIQQQLIHELDDLKWKEAGPANVRRFFELQNYENLVDKVFKMLTSELFGDWLSNITQLTPFECSGSVRKFNRGCYTMLRDDLREPAGLDVTLDIVGGAGDVVYVMDDHVDPVYIGSSCTGILRVCWRREGVRRFIRYSTEDSERVEFNVLWRVKEE